MKISHDRILVTGGAGFIGSHITDALLSAAVETWVLDNFSTGLSQNLSGWKNDRRLHLVRGEVTNFRLLTKLARRVDGIVHLAAQVSPYVSMTNPELTNDVNVNGTLNVLRAGEQEDVQKVVYASSSSVYGELQRKRMNENEPTTPITPYGVSKLAGEKYCQAFSRAFDLPTISLRYFNVFGIRQSSNPYSGVIAIFAKALTHGRSPIIYGDGRQTRDFTHVVDVVRANLLALQSHKGIGETFNIGTGHPTSINQLYSLMARISGRQDIRPIHKAKRPGDITDSCADISKAWTRLKFKPAIKLENALGELLNWLKSEARGKD
jgi:UDP-N-acetylglucosamine/UDP-N-acetyl-alpha-D-glucosaminouronate 4-epimerase